MNDLRALAVLLDYLRDGDGMGPEALLAAHTVRLLSDRHVENARLEPGRRCWVTWTDLRPLPPAEIVLN